jgi:hypothetical protein
MTSRTGAPTSSARSTPTATTLPSNGPACRPSQNLDPYGVPSVAVDGLARGLLPVNRTCPNRCSRRPPSGPGRRGKCLKRSERLRPGPWSGYDNEYGCNLCAVWMPSPRSDERLLSMGTFEQFVLTASEYRTREQGRVLVVEWARRHGEDPDPLLDAAWLRPLTSHERAEWECEQ